MVLIGFSCLSSGSSRINPCTETQALGPQVEQGLRGALDIPPCFLSTRTFPRPPSPSQDRPDLPPQRTRGGAYSNASGGARLPEKRLLRTPGLQVPTEASADPPVPGGHPHLPNSDTTRATAGQDPGLTYNFQLLRVNEPKDLHLARGALFAHAGSLRAVLGSLVYFLTQVDVVPAK